MPSALDHDEIYRVGQLTRSRAVLDFIALVFCFSLSGGGGGGAKGMLLGVFPACGGD